MGTGVSASYPPPTNPAIGIPRPTTVSNTSASRRIKPSSVSDKPPRASASWTSTPAARDENTVREEREEREDEKVGSGEEESGRRDG
jgi:hypothetical protein